MTTLRIFIPANWLAAQTACQWIIFDSKESNSYNQRLRQGSAEIKSLPIANEIEVVIDAELVSFLPATLPLGNRKKVLDTLPFLVEDSLMVAPEQMHVVVSGMLETKHSPANVRAAMLATIDKRYLTELLVALKKAGVSPIRVIPAQLLAELPDTGWAVVLQADNAFVRQSQHSGLALDLIDEHTPPIALQLAISEAKNKKNSPETLRLYDAAKIDIEAWSNALGVPCTQYAGNWRASRYSSELNFLQGAFTPPNVGWAWLKQAKPALIIAAMIGVVQLAGISLDWAQKAHQLNKIDAQMKQLFMDTFPESLTIVDAPLQMDRKFAELQHGTGGADGTDFLPMLASISAYASAARTMGSGSVQSIEYESGKLSFQLRAKSESEAQSLLQGATMHDLNASISNIKPNASGVDFQLTVKAGR